jgi:TATA-binding protein-associated factor
MSIDDVDAKLTGDVPYGQTLIDCLTALRFAAPELDSTLHPRLISLVPALISTLSSSHAVLRSTAAKCLATLCDVVTEDAMKVVVDSVVPLVGDAKRVSSRRGAVEAIHRECFR